MTWKWKTPQSEKCPICEESGKCIERHDDLEVLTRTETLRCRYCRHNFEEEVDSVPVVNQACQHYSSDEIKIHHTSGCPHEM